MLYYDIDGNQVKLSTKTMKKFKRLGVCSKVYHNEEMILKIYNSNTSNYCRLSKKMFKKLKEIHNNHLMEMYDIYTKKKRIKFQTDAYTAKYYNDEKINILDMPTDYILDNFREIDLLFQTLANKKIVVDDTKRENTVLTSNSIIVIDPDLFRTSPLPTELIKHVNKIEVLNLLRSILLECKKENEYKDILTAELINFSVEKDTDIANELSEKLKKYKKPIDYFK